MSLRQIATAAALLALVAAATTPAFAQSQPAEQPQAGQSQDGSQPAGSDQSTQEKKQ